MQIDVHNKQGKVICVISIGEENTALYNAEEWAWDTAQHIADELKKICAAGGKQFATAVDKMIEEERENPAWWQKLKRRFTRERYAMDIKVGDYPCPTCGCDTIQPICAVGPVTAVGFCPGYPVVGYACQNPDCQVYDVAIPRILVAKIYEKP